MDPKKIVIVGGVAGGATAATATRRLSEDAEIIVYERGPHVSFANCGLPYYVGGEIENKDALLVQTPQSLQARYKLDVRVRSTVVSIDRPGWPFYGAQCARCRSDSFLGRKEKSPASRRGRWGVYRT